MARKVFFSFHYDRDAWRVGVVRNSNVIKEFPKSTYYHDKAEWESIKRQGDAAVQRWIDAQLSGTSVTVVLIGQETASRKWVKYEIAKSIELGHGLIGVKINKIENSRGETDSDGANPLPGGYKVYLWNNNKGAENLARWIEQAAQDAKL
jgi:hypothetical protein